MSKKPVDYDELFPGRFLKAGLFKGKSVTLTIKDVEIEKLPQDNGKERDRGVISFNETPMQLALNSTNGQCLKAMFGRRPVEDWVGKRVTFVPEKDRFGKEVVDAIRVAGSPDLKAPIDVEIRMPRKKPKNRRLVPTVKNGSAASASEPEAQAPPADDFEPEPDLSQIQ
jgi:hypothetical protein